jgi:hypothetical protein
MSVVLQGITALYAVAVHAFRREQDAHTLTVGYSCVVFAWMAYLAASAGASVVHVTWVCLPVHLFLSLIGYQFCAVE